MSKSYSPSDYTAISPNYTTGNGYYTNVDLVTDLLQISPITGSTNPDETMIGQYIKRTEDYIDTRIGSSYRAITYKDEYHDFEFKGGGGPRYWSDYVGFIQLQQPYIQKILRLEVWKGNTWDDLASASSKVTVASSNTGVTSTIVLTLPNSSTITLNSGTNANTFNNTMGPKTTAQEIAYLINETFPTNTSSMTGATAAKSDAENPSKYFYATVDSEDENSVVISSKLPSDDGSACSIAVTGTGLSKIDFTDEENMKRLGSYWKIDREGRLFFRTHFPYHHRNSVRVTYIAGNHRVPGIISDAATKLVACEILRHDDQTVFIAETGSQIDIKGKYDLLKKEAEDLLNLSRETVYFIA